MDNFSAFKLEKANSLESIVLVGAAFKEDTDDLRNSPTLDMYKLLSDDGVDVVILDTEIDVPNHSYVSSVNDVKPNSLIAIMYPQKRIFLKNFQIIHIKIIALFITHGDDLNILITGGAGFVCICR